MPKKSTNTAVGSGVAPKTPYDPEKAKVIRKRFYEKNKERLLQKQREKRRKIADETKPNRRRVGVRKRERRVIPKPVKLEDVVPYPGDEKPATKFQIEEVTKTVTGTSKKTGQTKDFKIPLTQPYTPPTDLIPYEDRISTMDKNIPMEKLLHYRDQGLSHMEISKIVGCGISNVKQRLEYWDLQQPDLRFYKENKAEILARVQRMIISSITEADLQRMALRDRIVAFGVLFDKERIVRGEDILKIDIRVVHSSLEELQRKKEEIRQRLQSITALKPAPAGEESDNVLEMQGELEESDSP